MSGYMPEAATVEHQTPQWLFDELHAEFGFTCDVAASVENAKCAAYFTRETDGLAQQWSGVCWMNPPYGLQIRDWVKKAREAAEGGVTVVCLLPARTDTRWFHEHCLGRAELRFLKGRLKFGNLRGAAPFPSLLAIFRGVSRDALAE